MKFESIWKDVILSLALPHFLWSLFVETQDLTKHNFYDSPMFVDAIWFPEAGIRFKKLFWEKPIRWEFNNHRLIAELVEPLSPLIDENNIF